MSRRVKRKQEPEIIYSKKGSLYRNVPGTAGEKPLSGFKSHKEPLEKHKQICCVLGCNEKINLCGGHMQKNGSRHIEIKLLCSTHNNHTNTEIMEIKESPGYRVNIENDGIVKLIAEGIIIGWIVYKLFFSNDNNQEIACSM